jgi:hypothetical protein
MFCTYDKYRMCHVLSATGRVMDNGGFFVEEWAMVRVTEGDWLS